jgi:hypothetical protein
MLFTDVSLTAMPSGVEYHTLPDVFYKFINPPGLKERAAIYANNPLVLNFIILWLIFLHIFYIHTVSADQDRIQIVIYFYLVDICYKNLIDNGRRDKN